jgi:hypothetical protein
MNKGITIERGLSLFGQTLPFTRAFPMVAILKTTVWIRPYGRREENPQQRHFGRRGPPGEHIRCPNTECTNGGWCIGDIVRDMIAKRETHRTAEGSCNGWRRTNDSEYRKCLTHFTAEIELGYKSEAAMGTRADGIKLLP